MLSPKIIHDQVRCLTADFISLNLCDHQNYPSMKTISRSITEIGISKTGDISIVLKNLPYHIIYDELKRTETYNLIMLDGAIIHIIYRFVNNHIHSHRLAFFPSPYLAEFQNNPDIYLKDEIYAEVIMKNIVPFPLRFDFDCREEVAKELDHPMSHLTLGQYKNCRIPVSSPLTPYQFMSFVLRNFYHTAYIKYCENISRFNEVFSDTITGTELAVIYIKIPTGLKQGKQRHQ